MEPVCHGKKAEPKDVNLNYDLNELNYCDSNRGTRDNDDASLIHRFKYTSEYSKPSM